MTRGPLAAPAVVKEVRLLLPVWLATMSALAVMPALGRTFLVGLAYVVGTVLLGALALGSEYSHRTLGVLLAQPVPRHRILGTKLAVLAALLLLASSGWLLLPAAGLIVPASHYRPEMALAVTLAPVYAFTLAPCLTMLCRNPLAGVVFTLAVPACLLVGADLLGTLLLGGADAAAVDRFARAVFWPALLASCAVAGVFTWRLFMRLEVIEGHGPEVRLPWLWSAGLWWESLPRDPRGPAWNLVMKELRLQQLTFAVAALYVTVWMAMGAAQRLSSDADLVPLWPVTIMYFGLLCVLIGSLASAEERQFGTLEAQLLVPVAAWRQWAIKAAVAIVLAFVLAVGLPALLALALSPRDHLGDPLGAVQLAIPVVVVLTTCSLYVSTLCVGGVKALVWSLPFVLGVALSLQGLTQLWWVVFSSLYEWLPGRLVEWAVYRPMTRWLPLPPAVALVVALLYAGFLNHRASDRSASRLVRQLLTVAAVVTAATFLSAVIVGVIALRGSGEG